MYIHIYHTQNPRAKSSPLSPSPHLSTSPAPTTLPHVTSSGGSRVAPNLLEASMATPRGPLPRGRPPLLCPLPSTATPYGLPPLLRPAPIPHGGLASQIRRMRCNLARSCGGGLRRSGGGPAFAYPAAVLSLLTSKVQRRLQVAARRWSLALESTGTRGEATVVLDCSPLHLFLFSFRLFFFVLIFIRFFFITGSEPEEPKLNLLGSMFSKEPIGPCF